MLKLYLKVDRLGQRKLKENTDVAFMHKEDFT